MCRNCNCAREDHANPDNKKEKVNVKFIVKENTHQSRQQQHSNDKSTTSSSVVVRLSAKDKVPPPVSPKGNTSKTKMFIKQESENIERKLSASNNESKISAASINERKNSTTSNKERNDSSSNKENVEQIKITRESSKEERRGSLRDENGVKTRMRIDPKDRLKLAEEEKRKSELQFSELDSMIDQLLDEKV